MESLLGPADCPALPLRTIDWVWLLPGRASWVNADWCVVVALDFYRGEMEVGAMVSLPEELQAREEATARRRVEELQAEAAELAIRLEEARKDLSRLEITRETVQLARDLTDGSRHEPPLSRKGRRASGVNEEGQGGAQRCCRRFVRQSDPCRALRGWVA